MSTTESIEWHRLIDGDPPEIGRYIVAHRACSVQLSFYPSGHRQGWWGNGAKRYDVTFFTHWAKEPCAPDDGTPRPRDRPDMRHDADEAASWAALAAAQEARSALSEGQ